MEEVMSKSKYSITKKQLNLLILVALVKIAPNSYIQFSVLKSKWDKLLSSYELREIVDIAEEKDLIKVILTEDSAITFKTIILQKNGEELIKLCSEEDK